MQPDATQDDPISTDILMRWVVEQKRLYNATATPPIQEKAFHPRSGADDSGLSLSRRQSPLRPNSVRLETC